MAILIIQIKRKRQKIIAFLAQNLLLLFLQFAAAKNYLWVFFFYFAFSPYLLLQMIMMLLSILVCSCCCCYSCLALLKYCLHSSNKCSNISFYYFFAKKYKEIHYDVDVDEDFNVEMQKIWVNTFIELAEMSLNGFFMKRKNKIWFLEKKECLQISLENNLI